VSRLTRRNGHFSPDDRDIFPFRLIRAICSKLFFSKSDPDRYGITILAQFVNCSEMPRSPINPTHGA
jgi:hypothetical protein